MKDEKIKKKRRSREEIEIERIDKLARKEKRIAVKKEKERIKEEKRIKRMQPISEEEEVKKYVNKIINNQKYHGRIDGKFKDIAYKEKVNKNLWLDSNFYVSVVFESEEQKVDFINQIGVTQEEIAEAIYCGKVNIINGLVLAKKLNIKLKPEKRDEYPLPELDLLPYVLDTESFKD